MKGKKTNIRAVTLVQEIAVLIGKQPVVLRRESQGFIVNRLLFALLSEAIKLQKENVATFEDIDQAIELGLNHPMGPFKLMDLIGIDVSYEILRNLSHLYHKQVDFTVLQDLIKKNQTGRKAGAGFYRYDKK